MNHHDATWVLMYIVVPLWFAVGVADWACHRRTRIEATAGPAESLLHILMFVEVGIPLLAALLLEVNALVFAAFLAAFLLHEWTAWMDIRLATSRREVSPFEQQIHSFLEILPLMVIVLLALAYREEFLAMLGLGTASSDFSVRLKQPPLPMPYLLFVASGIVLFVVLPYLEELWRCLRYRRVADKPAIHGAQRARAP